MTINRKLQIFANRVRGGCRLGCLLSACALLALTPFSRASINIPSLPSEKKDSEKKKDAPPPRPPQAVPVTVQVQNGGTVQVALRVYGRQEQTTKFLIRKEPTLGKILSLEPAEREVWILTYQHTSPMNGQLSLQDRILVAAQNKNGTSSAAAITLNILDNPPELAAPGPVEFGEIAAGIATTRNLTIANKGGGTLEGTVTVDAPWSVEPGSYKLEHGQETSLRITLTPQAEQEYQGRLHFSFDPKTEPALHAVAVAPFTVEPAALELPGASQNQARSASVTLTNRTDAPLTLQLEANERLHLPTQILLPAGATQTLQPTLAADDREGMEGTLRVSLGAVARKISIHAESLATAAPSPLPQAKATPSPANVAGYPSLLSPPSLAPKVGVPPTPPPPAPTTNTESPSNKAAELPMISGLTVVRTTSDGIAEFAWDPPKLPASTGTVTYRVEVRRLTLDANGKLVQNWIPVPEVKFDKNERRVTALVTGIPPGISDTAHIVALNARNEPCAVSFPQPFHIPVPVQLLTLRNVLLAGFVLLLFLALGLRIKEKRSRDALP